MEANDTNVKTPVYKKWWFWVIIVIVIAAIGAASTQGAENKEPSKETAASMNAATQSPVPDSDEKFYLSETAVFENLKITAVKVEESEGDTIFKPEEGKVFVGIKISIENISQEDQIISSILLFDSYEDGVKSSYSASAMIAFSNGTLDGTLSSGKKMEGYYAIEASCEWKEIELEVKASWLSSSKATFVIKK